MVTCKGKLDDQMCGFRKQTDCGMEDGQAGAGLEVGRQ